MPCKAMAHNPQVFIQSSNHYQKSSRNKLFRRLQTSVHKIEMGDEGWVPFTRKYIEGVISYSLDHSNTQAPVPLVSHHRRRIRD